MNAKRIATLVTALFLTTAVFAARPHVRPKITMRQARAIALKRAPGTVKSSELETEHGRLVYSFDIITSHKRITEVNVDARSGKIVAVQHESRAREAAEKRQEHRH